MRKKGVAHECGQVELTTLLLAVGNAMSPPALRHADCPCHELDDNPAGGQQHRQGETPPFKAASQMHPLLT